MKLTLPVASAMLYGLTGGYADAASYLLAKSFTGHVTGNTVLLGLTLMTGGPGVVSVLIPAVTCFLLATATAQYVRSTLGAGRSTPMRFAVPVAEMLLVGIAPLLFAHAGYGPALMISALCLALGLQNGWFSKADGISIHTTYLTGTITSLLKAVVGSREAAPKQNTKAQSTTFAIFWVLVSFFLGVLCAAFSVPRIGARALWLLELPLLLTIFFDSQAPTQPAAA